MPIYQNLTTEAEWEAVKAAQQAIVVTQEMFAEGSTQHGILKAGLTAIVQNATMEGAAKALLEIVPQASGWLAVEAALKNAAKALRMMEKCPTCGEDHEHCPVERGLV
jgi:hypothetical protein